MKLMHYLSLIIVGFSITMATVPTGSAMESSSDDIPPLADFLNQNQINNQDKQESDSDRDGLATAIKRIERLKTPLSYAAQADEIDAVRLELENGADANDSGTGPCPLWWAVFNHNPEIITLLRQYGADPKLIANEKTNQTALQYAQERLSFPKNKLAFMMF